VFDIATCTADGPSASGQAPWPPPIVLVVREAVAAEGDVVHRPLALRRDVDRPAQREEDDVGDPARGLDVAGGDRGRRSRIDEGVLWRTDSDGSEGTT